MNMSMIKSDNGEYFGQVKDRKRHGEGIYIGYNGCIYEGKTYFKIGQWKQDLRSGIGYQKNPDGSTYYGTFKDDRP